MNENKQYSDMAMENVRLHQAVSKMERMLFEKPSLRDQFAMAALQGICSTLSRDRINDIFDGTQGGRIEAETALRIADAMLKARNAKPA